MTKSLKNKNDLLLNAVKNKNIQFLCWYFFNTKPTGKQLDIIGAIAFKESHRLVISAFTRYGKSWAVSQGIILYIWLNKNKRILLLAPSSDQTSILRNYVSEFLLNSEEMIDLLNLDVKGAERIKKETSRSRITFKNDCELKVLSASGTAERLMGWGGDLIILDESCLIEYETYRQKISRMLGDRPDSILIEIGNPWHRNNQMWEHWTDPKFKKIHIGYEDGLKEGRITQQYVEEQRSLLTDIEFTILYKAEFPEDAEDTLIKWEWINAARKKNFDFDAPQEIAGLDVAEMGVDLTVLTKALTEKNKYRIINIKSWGKKDTMQTVGMVLPEIDKKTNIQVDEIGVGKGVADRLRELNYRCTGIKVGRSAITEKDRFLNQKSEFYWTMRKAFEEGRVSIPSNNKLIEQLRKMRYEITSAGKIHILDPQSKSPDFADSLMLVFAKPEKEWMFGELSM